MDLPPVQELRTHPDRHRGATFSPDITSVIRKQHPAYCVNAWITVHRLKLLQVAYHIERGEKAEAEAEERSAVNYFERMLYICN